MEPGREMLEAGLRAGTAGAQADGYDHVVAVQEAQIRVFSASPSRATDPRRSACATEPPTVAPKKAMLNRGMHILGLPKHVVMAVVCRHQIGPR